MSLEEIEKGYEAFYQAVEEQQNAIHGSFYDGYIAHLETVLHDYTLDESHNLYNKEQAERLKAYYHTLSKLKLEPEERRKITQLTLLKGGTIEPLQPNHQLTPDSIGFLMIYLMEALTDRKEIRLLDPAVGAGNLLSTALVNLPMANIQATGIGVDIDDTLLQIAALDADWEGLPIHFFHQDGIQPLYIEPVDMVISDLPIGYYPLDDQAQGFKSAAKEGHSYAHHLLMEASMRYLKDDGYALFLVPDNLLTSEQAPELKNWLNDSVYIQAMLRLPASLFKNEHGQKNIMILQNRTEKTKQAEVLVAELPSLSHPQDIQRFVAEFSQWKAQNLT